MQSAVKRAEELDSIAPRKRIGTHTLRHSYARHLFMDGIPINYLSRWLGHSSIQTTLIYLEFVPDPLGSLRRLLELRYDLLLIAIAFMTRLRIEMNSEVDPINRTGG